MVFERLSGVRNALVGVVVGALVVSLGLVGTGPAFAAGPPATLTLEAINPATGATVTQVESNREFAYTASVGCPDPSGCGPTTVTVVFPSEVEFIASGFTPPNGTTYALSPEGGPATGKTLTINWDNLDQASLIYLPAKVSADADSTLNGSLQEATARLVSGVEPDVTTIEDAAQIRLRVYERPGILSSAQTWSSVDIAEGSRAEAELVTTAVAAANSPSSLSFRVPGTAAIPEASLPVAEAFDLTGLRFNANPGGISVVFTLQDGTTSTVSVPAGTLAVDAPAETVGYDVTVSGLPALGSTNVGQRTVSVTGDYTLRDSRRSDGRRIIGEGANIQSVRATADVTNRVSDVAPNAPTTLVQQTHRDIVVAALLPSIARSTAWITTSGDRTSVYESGEGSTVTVRLSNTGVPVLSEATLRLTANQTSRTADYFDYQKLTANPEVVFPAGSTRASIRYNYATAPVAGEAQEFFAGAAVPGPEGDGRTLEEIVGITVTFFATDDGGITGNCALDNDDCAARVILTSVLRDKRLSNNSPITAPSGNPGTTLVEFDGTVVATAATGARITENLPTASITLVKPQFTAKLSKNLGSDADRIVYPLTGEARAGDVFDPEIDPQNYRDHALRLSASTSPSAGATEDQGPTGLTISDPQTTPTNANLKSNPFNTIKLSALSSQAAVCTDANGGTVASTTSYKVWVLGTGTSPTVTKVDYTDGMELDRVVGFEVTILPAEPAARFPVTIDCDLPAGTTVTFRNEQLSGPVKVDPNLIGSSDTPGLLTVGNTAEVRTGINTATATGGDAMFLLDLARASVFKDYASGAKKYGIQGQESPTAFLLAGVPESERSVRVRMTDGPHSGSSLDVFALTGLRDARVGPDQRMTITMNDIDGNPIGPVGEVEASTSHKGEELSAEDIEDSQSAGYLDFQRVDREIEWSGSWVGFDSARVFSVQVEVTRADPTVALQRFGAFSVVADMKLRTHLLTNPAVIVNGSLAGIIKRNRATLTSMNEPGGWTTGIVGTADFTVYAADQLFGDATASWQGTLAENYLVAQHQSPSHVVLTASNKTALGVDGVPPANQWSATGSIAVGVDSIAVGVGNGPGTATNDPFAITDFTGIELVTWPDREGAPSSGGQPANNKVAGVIHYLFADGTTLDVPAPVNAQPATLNPPSDRFADVVGVHITWSEEGKRVGLNRPTAVVQGELRFFTNLRDYVRTGYTYRFVAGVPDELASDQSIDGATQIPGETVTQQANLTANYAARMGNVTPLDLTVDSANLAIDVAASSVNAAVSVTGTGTLNRDLLPNRTWVLVTQNTGNIPVRSLRMATAAEFLDGAHWPSADPDGYTLEPGSALDAFDVQRVQVRYPVGAVTARVWVRGEDGKWSDAITAADNADLTLPSTGDGPKTWAEATGFRVQFDGDENTRKRILKRSIGALNIESKLRTHLRSDPTEVSPATDLPSGASQWVVGMTGGGASFMDTFTVPLAEVTNARGETPIYPGTPAPLVRKYAGRYDPVTNTGTTTTNANPGSWVNFFVVLQNNANASSNLYNLTAIDVLPPELAYNAVFPSSEWRVTSAPEGVSRTPEMTLVPGDRDSMRWTWPADNVLRPGEKIVLQVPLQMSDGVASGSSGTNTARLVGSGILGALPASVCADESSANANCVSTANASFLQNDSVRAESYINAAIGGSETEARTVCDPSTNAEWPDGDWVRNPCIALTTAGATLTYRAKLINSGNSALSQFRFVDELPAIGDTGAVLETARNSQWTAALVPGSVRLLGGAEAEAIGARGDAAFSAEGLRYSSTGNACRVAPDAFGGANTLACDAGTWSGTATPTTHALGADIVFADDARMLGGEFVVVEFDVTVPETSTTPRVAWNSVAATGRVNAASSWLPAAESPRSGARAQDSELTLTLNLRDDPVTRWHLGSTGYALDYACLAPGAESPVTGTANFAGIGAVDETLSITVTGLPLGASCSIVDQRYQPTGTTPPGQYGSVSAGTTGYGFSTDPEDALVLGTTLADNVIATTNAFAEAVVTLAVEVDGDATFLPADAPFEVAMSCTFAGITENYGPFSLVPGDTQRVDGLPVGVTCTPAETNSRGAATVTATLNTEAVPLDANRAFDAETLEPGTHDVVFLNTFNAGGDLTILKRVETPSLTTTVGDARFTVVCTLAGAPIALGDVGTFTLAIAAGETTASRAIAGLPVGAECVVTETESGGANIAAPERTVTILDGEPVTVEMLNTYSPAALELTKVLTGPGAGESRVPGSFEARATCTRELTVGGAAVTVTDHDALTVLRPGTAVRIDALPEGSVCTITEPDLRGAESVSIDPVTPGVVDQQSAANTARVALVGPGADGNPIPTAVRVTNTYAATPGVAGPGGSILGSTGAQHAVGLGALALATLLAGLGAFFFRRRGRTE
ncbi:hypothetical protein M2390_000540 [Mycetocola sp. BIGb0189]|uniref:DUF5979 domain-containing protein n=1 Tax=Mycetocola sp. BIGb0189 TaxID=2940604 RepID=UPI002166E124|nr:DUF5979 domain-containing protein [Mycetocola sp. BIGb0189]MCS4275379.1 hypothetical protein [Mycetocola sp. BIGb0189]